MGEGKSIMEERLKAADVTPCDRLDQIAFARHVFDNYQALIRSVDTKAGALFALAVFLGASIFPIFKDATSHVSLKTPTLQITSMGFLLSGSSFILLFLWLIGSLARVIRPRGARFYKAICDTENLLWQEHVATHADNASYFQAVSDATHDVILRNLTDQVFELAHISREKMSAINTGFRLLYLLAFSWILTITSGLILTGWKQ
jgi:hypothetical protein